MKGFIKVALAFSMGAGAGFAVANAYLKDRYKDIADEEIESVKSYYENKIEDLFEPEEKQPEKRTTKKNDSESTTKKNKITEKEKKEYEKLTESYSTEDNKDTMVLPTEDDISNLIKEEMVFEGLIKDPSPDDDIPDEPYIITYDEYSEDNRNYDKLELLFYVNDGYLIDPDTDEPVELIDSIGVEASDILHYADSDMCFRNDRTCTDYLVTRVIGSYNLGDPIKVTF